MENTYKEVIFKLDNNLTVECNYLESNDNYHIIFKCQKYSLILHWGIGSKAREWICPSEDIIETVKNTTKFNEKAAQSIFLENIDIFLNKKYKFLNFVFYDSSNNKWYNNDNKDFTIKLENLKVIDSIPYFIEDIINCEVNYGSWTLMHRYNKCYDILNGIDLSDINSLYYIFIWLRYSFIRQLDWQRNFNTKPRELSYSLSRLTYDITNKMINIGQKTYSFFTLDNYNSLRMCLSTLGKGTGDGQKIRDEILHILHRHHIKETNDHFYEQWHQKLHNNTTPDDIVICEALIAFQKSGGKMNVYWDTLKAGGVTKERLMSFDRKITYEPYYFPALLPDLESYLYTLKSVHSSNDLIIMFNSTKYAFGNDYYLLDDIIKNKDHWDTIAQILRITKGRQAILNIINNNRGDINKVRDLLFFDLCLEINLRQLIEKIIHIELEFKHYITEIIEISKNIYLTFKFDELKLSFEDLSKLSLSTDTDNVLKIKSVIDRFSRILTNIIDNFSINLDKKAKLLGKSFNCEEYAINIFTEEIIRGSIFFALSMVLKKTEPLLRKMANLGNWHVISPGKNNFYYYGKVTYVKNLNEVQFKKYEVDTILLTQIVGGNEEIPENVSCVIMVNSSDYPDVLSHVSVRARNLGVPFFVCLDENTCNLLNKNQGKHIKVNYKNKILDFSDYNPNDLISKEFEQEEIKHQQVKITDGFPKTLISMNEFDKILVGAKSNNTKKIFGNLPDWVKFPESCAIPFNVCEYYLDLPENLQIKVNIEKIIGSITHNNSNYSKDLSECRNQIMKLKFINNDNTDFLIKGLISFGIPETQINSALESIKAVWASKYNERAFISVSKIGVKLEEIRMAVLVQKIISADYAFVIHTKNPSNNDENELYAEVVTGMGETLVGKYEGQSLSFVYNKKSKKAMVTSYPNKSISLKSEGFIFRSDSNTEDLEGFAGAGLFDSIPINKMKEIHMSYNQTEFFTNKSKIEQMMEKISQLGIEVENIYNTPQDIEGVFKNSDIYIVQTRPQV